MGKQMNLLVVYKARLLAAMLNDNNNNDNALTGISYQLILLFLIRDMHKVIGNIMLWIEKCKKPNRNT